VLLEFLSIVGFRDKNWGDEAKALDFTTKVIKNAPCYPKMLVSSDVFFKQGQGDVLINYENEVILAIANGEKPLCDTRR